MHNIPLPSTSDTCVIDLRDAASIRMELVRTLITTVGRDPVYAVPRDWYAALAFLLRGILSHHLAETGRRIHESGAKRVYYFSLEYLPGRSLPKVLADLGMNAVVESALQSLDLSIDMLAALESDIALGNGGLGRLAACFLDSMATHGYPGFGYGIRYEFGLFSQTIDGGQQVEHPESWLRYGDPWQIRRPTVIYPVNFYGKIERSADAQGQEIVRWIEADTVMAVAYDMPISGYGSPNVLYLRLWSARASRDLDLKYFNEGNYVEAVREKAISESLSKVLYPNDSTAAGSELRLKQEFFFVSASLQDILRRHLKSNESLDNLSEKISVQLNDTHPSLAIPELMRVLIDVHSFPWAKAWRVVSTLFGYTNHTLLPEALETWPIAMLERLLPRHLDIIYRINQQHLERVKQKFPGETWRLGQLSLVDDFSRRIRMSYLAVVGSRRTNGVSQLQTQLLRETVFPGFAQLDPNGFVAITNGITQRQWLMIANPALADLITGRIGDGWITDLDRLNALIPYADDEVFRADFMKIKRANKVRLAELIKETTGENVDPTTMFDVQVKRIHEYKRQLLNVLHVITLYRRIKSGHRDMTPRTVIFGGKAAPGYDMAKLIIRLISDVAHSVNRDPDVNGFLRVVFVPDYKVSVAEIIIPAADLAQHISTVGTEASGTSNMKFALNGAMIIGTLDGANIEICDAVGADNIFMFGPDAHQVVDLRARGYNPWPIYQADPELKAAVDMIGDGSFSPVEPDRYVGIKDSLLSGGDHFLLFTDYRPYVEAQLKADQAYRNTDDWTRRTILNTAHIGRFSSDRAIEEYAAKIWDVKPLQRPTEDVQPRQRVLLPAIRGHGLTSQEKQAADAAS